MYQRRDAFYNRAKAAGYRSRAAFKLLQLAQRHRLFRPGDRVVDIGAWPGGWLQVAAEQVGPSGRTIGVDLHPIDPLPHPCVITVVGDITDPGTQAQVLEACGGKADVVLSDLAPKLSGVRPRDDAQVEALTESVLRFTGALLRPGGTLVIKLFMGNQLPRFVARLRARYQEVHTTRPAATRKASSEIYAVATGFRGAPEGI